MTDPQTSTPLASRSPNAITVDNLLRRTLRVSDPSDPQQIAGALLDRYAADAELIRREREGLPFASTTAPLPTSFAGPPSGSVAEIAQARDDLERDLDSLQTTAALKDIRVEIRGWARSLRQTAANGLAAAAQALDAVQLNTALAARRSFGDYARLARYIGALTPDQQPAFRQFAQSCDVMAGLILVAIGDGYAASGITRSTAMLRVSAGELQSRRNAVVLALRTMTGTVEASLGQEDWPRGLEAFRQLTHALDNQGQADLRALLEENTLASALDELVDLTTGGSVNSLRDLSTASAMLVGRLQRLVEYGQTFAAPDYRETSNDPNATSSPESPPMSAFVSALSLFVDAFRSVRGARLLDISRPTMLLYGLYNSIGTDQVADRLRRLVSVRGALAQSIDCFADCGCDSQATQCQILLDLLLYNLDRCIDYYALSPSLDGRGEPEIRAYSLADLIMSFGHICNELEAAGRAPEISHALDDALNEVQRIVSQEWGYGSLPRRDRSIVIRELSSQYLVEARVQDVARSLAPACKLELVFDYRRDRSVGLELIGWVLEEVYKVAVPQSGGPISIPPTLSTSVSRLAFGRANRRQI